MYLPLARRIAIRSALPFQSEYPACAFGAARRDYAAARKEELAKLKDARSILRERPSDYHRAWHLRTVDGSRRYLANIRAARVAILRAEG